MNAKELKKLKEAYFAESARRTGIPLQYYELPAEVIEEYERKKKAAQAEQRAMKANLHPTRGEVSLHRRGRRSTGDFSLLDDKGD